MEKQVDKEHYRFTNYITKHRWASMWHQIDEVLSFEPKTVLEVGPGPGVFKTLASRFGPNVESLDIDPDLEPDHVASADSMPFGEGAFDVVCAFQMLEHVPYEKSLAIFRDMARVAKKGVVISLPDAKRIWPFMFYIPTVGALHFHIPRPRFQPKEHFFDGEHYWEINKLGYPLSKIQRDLEKAGNLNLAYTYRVNENTYHRFFVFKKG